MHFFSSAALLCSLVGAAFSAGYAPVPVVAPAPTSYGNPYVNYNTQPLQNAQPFYVNQQPLNTFSQQPLNTFNGALPVISPANMVAPPAPSGAVVGNNGHVAALTSEDDWDSLITARGVKNQKIGKKVHRAH